MSESSFPRFCCCKPLPSKDLPKRLIFSQKEIPMYMWTEPGCLHTFGLKMYLTCTSVSLYDIQIFAYRSKMLRFSSHPGRSSVQ